MDKNENNNKYCEICKELANCICFDCYMYFCDSCFKIIHEKQKNNNHEKEKIDYFVPFDTKCPLHTKDRINLFCIDEKGKNIQFIIFNLFLL